MTVWLWCYKCKMATLESDMVAYGEWNPDVRRTLVYLACPCGEREDCGAEAFQCDKCEERFPESGIEIDTDLCIDCAAATQGVW